MATSTQASSAQTKSKVVHAKTKVVQTKSKVKQTKTKVAQTTRKVVQTKSKIAQKTSKVAQKPKVAQKSKAKQLQQPAVSTAVAIVPSETSTLSAPRPRQKLALPRPMPRSTSTSQFLVVSVNQWHGQWPARFMTVDSEPQIINVAWDAPETNLGFLRKFSPRPGPVLYQVYSICVSPAGPSSSDDSGDFDYSISMPMSAMLMVDWMDIRRLAIQGNLVCAMEEWDAEFAEWLASMRRRRCLGGVGR